MNRQSHTLELASFTHGDYNWLISYLRACYTRIMVHVIHAFVRK